MSKTSLRSRMSTRSLNRLKKMKNLQSTGKKQFGFCCAIGDYDPLSNYDQQKAPFKSSLTDINSIHECPVLKVRTKFIERGPSFLKRKAYKSKTGSTIDQAQWNSKSKSTAADASLGFLEDYIDLSISEDVYQKKEAYIEENKKNLARSRQRAKAELKKTKRTGLPNWYQDFSNTQMKYLMILKRALCDDYEEKVTHRTQETLAAIGIVSTFFKLAPNTIKTLQQKSNLTPVTFLREIYKIITGVDFENEDYKEKYNCNEKLILSAIAFLTLPETVIELNERLPPIEAPEYPPKPKPPQALHLEKVDSPYKTKLFPPPDMRLYKIELFNWQNKIKMIPKPKVILPPKEKNSFCEDVYRAISEKAEENIDKYTDEERFQAKNERTQEIKVYDTDNINRSSKGLIDFTLSDLGEHDGPVQYKIRGTLDPSQPKYKSWPDEKDVHYVISGILNEDEPPEGPVSYELTGHSKVTPNNSNEEFFAKLKLGDGPKKIYPEGRKYLSKNWQEWLQNVDEEFIKVENEANKLIESVEATMKLVIPSPNCDNCCACRQTRKADIKRHATKTPYMVVDTVAEDSDKNRFIVGSVSMHSPAPSVAESMVNLLEVVASHDNVTKNLLINGITNEDGQTIYYISGVTTDTEHVPKEIIERTIPKSVKNIPPCACTIEKIFNEGFDQEPSDDNIPNSKDGLCCGKKYRPENGPAYTCKQYPEDKSCRQNPFKKKLEKMGKKDDQMAFSGGPWGITNVLDTEELTRREEEAKQILQAPPCEEKSLKNEDEEEEKNKVENKPVETQISKTETLNQDRLSHMSPNSFTDKSEAPEETELDWNKCDNQDEWNAREIASSAKKIKSIYESNLNFTQAKPQVSEDIKKYEKREKVERKLKKEEKTKGIKKSMKENFTLKRIPRSKKLITIKKKKNCDNALRSRTFPVKKLDTGMIGAKSKIRKMGKSLDNQNIKETSHSKGNNLKVGIMQNKRLVNSAEKSNSAKPKTNPKTKKAATNNIFAAGEPKEMKNKKRFVISSNKLSRLEAFEKQKKGIQSKPLKLEQLKEEIENFKMLPDMEINPAVIPEQNSKLCKREEKYEELKYCESQSLSKENDYASIKEGPFGWRTESEQKLSPQKTLIYLTKPTYPMGTVPVRPGGKPCLCRENRNKKKKFKYNISGIQNEAEGKKQKVQNVTQVIEGVTYVTPPPSPRRSDEYIPEYELYESPYDMCAGQKTGDTLKLTGKFLGPPSLVSKKQENKTSCGCGYEDLANEIYSNENKNQLKEKMERTSESASNEWNNALEDAGLVDFFTKCRDDIPCWLKCSKFSKDGCSNNIKKLQVKRPVCECKYERKIVLRNEERQKWLERQEKLKSYEKTPFTHITGISRPMEKDTKFIISGVKRIPNEDGTDKVKYCVSGVAENYKMGPAQQLIEGVTMQTPVVTPKPSEKHIPCVCAHKHWSVTQLPENMTSSEKEETEKASKVQENQNKYAPRRSLLEGCDDADRCKELDNIKEDSNYKGGTDRVNSVEIKEKDIKNHEKKLIITKRRQKEKVQENLNNFSPGQKQTESNLQKRSSPTMQLKTEAKIKKVKKYFADKKSNLLTIVKNELEEMSTKGFVFAKLPMCHKMPQIKYWIMYRKGEILTDRQKEKLMQHSLKLWGKLTASKPKNIRPPPMGLNERQLENLNFDKVYELKKAIADKKDIFYSQVRINRVNKSAALWNTMEFGKFPSLSFKEAYFTYFPGKEVDGHIL